MKLEQMTTQDIDKEIFQEMTNKNMLTPVELIKDGMIHRFHANASKSTDNDSGWYVLFDDGVTAGAFGDWSRDITVRFTGSGKMELTPEERAFYEQRVKDAQEKARKDRAARAEEVSTAASQIWENLPPCPADHPYLLKKGLKGAYGARLQGAELVIPVMDMDGKVWSLQNISGDGEKRYMSGGRIDGHFWVVGHGQPKWMCEGMATAASIYEATGQPVVVAYNARNLVPVAKQFPGVTIVADNDDSETGEKYARETGLPVKLIPVKGMDANDYAQAGRDLRAFLMPRTSYVLRTLKDTVADVKAPEWLIKGWIPKGSYFGMNFGPSGNGKTFVIIDMIMCISTGMEWHGRKVNQGKCIYLCGEGLGSVMDRLKVWIQEKGVEAGTWPYISEGATDIDTPDGFEQLTAAVETLGDKPDLIVIDTLNRFMKGDENSTQDATALIQACKRLQDMYQCCVMLVHHTGLAGDAQDRARGSSAFKGALDFQHMTEKSGEVFTITQTKVKRGKTQEPIRLALEDHCIGYDEDGNEISSAILVDPENSPIERKGQKQVDDETLLTSIMVNYGYMYVGMPYISYERMHDALIDLKSDAKDPEETVRKMMRFGKITSDKPRFLERLYGYGDLVPDYGRNSEIIGYQVLGYLVNGVLEPHFSMNLEQKSRTLSDIVGHFRTPNGHQTDTFGSESGHRPPLFSIEKRGSVRTDVEPVKEGEDEL